MKLDSFIVWIWKVLNHYSVTDTELEYYTAE